MAVKRAPSRPHQAESLLLIVDMLNGFLAPGGSLYCGDDARRIVPFVARTVESYHQRGRPVIFICDAHDPDDPEFDVWAPHCVRGTWEAQIIDELPTRGASVLHKSTLSAFYRTRLNSKLRAWKPKVVELVGVCTNICILLTAAELEVHNYKARVLKDGVASFDRKAHRQALELMPDSFGAEVV